MKRRSTAFWSALCYAATGFAIGLQVGRGHGWAAVFMVLAVLVGVRIGDRLRRENRARRAAARPPRAKAAAARSVHGAGGCHTTMTFRGRSIVCDDPAPHEIDGMRFCDLHHRYYVAHKLRVLGHPENGGRG